MRRRKSGRRGKPFRLFSFLEKLTQYENVTEEAELCKALFIISRLLVRVVFKSCFLKS